MLQYRGVGFVLISGGVFCTNLNEHDKLALKRLRVEYNVYINSDMKKHVEMVCAGGRKTDEDWMQDYTTKWRWRI